MPQLNPLLSVTLARRLAEVADTYRSFQQVYLVAEREFPKPVQSAQYAEEPVYNFPDEPIIGFPSFEEASTYFTQHNFTEAEWGIYGPYLTPQNEVQIKWDNKWASHEIQKATIKVAYTDDTVEEIELEEGVDTIFLNLSAFDKFAMPYYAKNYGVNYAKQLRAYVLNSYTTIGGNGDILMALPKPRTLTLTRAAGNNETATQT